MEIKYEFEVGDKVLAYYDGLLYRAKCLKRQVTDTGVKQYFIHYEGFKSRWDEWTDEDEVLEINAINLAHKERRESSRKECRRLKRVKISQKPSAAEDASSNSALRKRGRPNTNVGKNAEPIVVQSGLRKRGRPFKNVDKNAEPVVVQSGLRKRGRPFKNVDKNAEPVVVQSGLRKRGRPFKNVEKNAEPVVVQSGLRKRGKPTKNEKQTAESSILQSTLRRSSRLKEKAEQTAEPVLQSALRRSSRIKKKLEQTAEAAVLHTVLRKSVGKPQKNKIQTPEQNLLESPLKRSRRSEESIQHTGEPVVQSVLRKSVRSKKNVNETAKPVLQSTIIPLVEQTAIPCPKHLLRKLQSLKLPISLERMFLYDDDMHRLNSMILNFPEKHFVAEVIFAFTKSSFFVDDNQKKYSMMFPVTILKYFNESVHTHLIYENEKIFNLPKKGMEYFQQRMIDRPYINYVFKSHLDSNMIWCYLYGPTHLLRLIVNLPKILGSNSWHSGYDVNAFILHIKQLLKFLDHYFDIYFPINDYRRMDGKCKTRKLFNSSFFCYK